MTDLINTVLFVVNVASTAIAILFGIFAVYEQLAGPEAAQKLLNKLPVPIKYKHVLIIGFICLLLVIVTRMLKPELFGEL